MKIIEVDGEKFAGSGIDIFGAELMVIRGSRGFLACSYVNIETADRLGHAAAVVSGVKNFDDMLAAKVRRVSQAAAAMGVKEGMTGAEALKIFL